MTHDTAHGGGHAHGAHDPAHDHAHGSAHAHGHDHGHAHEGGHAHAAAGHDDHAHAHAEEVVADKPLGQPRKRVRVGDVEFALIDEGQGPAILLLHGFPTSCGLWRKVIPELAGFRCIAPDLLGLGDTEGPVDADMGMDRQAELVLGLLDALGVAGEVTVVGHDWGGVVAQAIAATAPERVSNLILVDSPAFGSPAPAVVARLRKAARWSVAWDAICDTGFMRWFAGSGAGIPAGAHDPASISPDAIAAYIRPLYRDTPPAYRAGRERFRRALIQNAVEIPELTASLADALRRFEKPTLVVWGCEDPYIPLSYGKTLADEIPGCVGFELVPFCGHWVPEEKPTELARLIAAHLRAPRAVAEAAGVGA